MTLALRNIIVIATVVMLTSLTLYSGFDRIAHQNAVLVGPRFIPKGAERIRKAAASALNAGQFDAAARLARAAVVRDPINPASLSLLGAAQLRSGDFQGAQRSYLAAGSLGWRDADTQAYIVAQAEAARDTRVMAERVDALLRTGQPYTLLAPTLRKIEEMSGGASELVIRLSLTPDWSDAYISQATLETDSALTRRLAILREAKTAGLVVDCEKVDDAVTALLAVDRPKIAYAYWRQLSCGDAGPYNLNATAGGFAEISNVPSKRPTSFGWSFEASSLIEARIEPVLDAGAANAIYISGGGPNPVVAVRRALLLSPGRYRLKWRSRNIRGEARLDVAAEVICYNNGLPVTIRSASPNVDVGPTALLVVPPKGCGAQQLRFVVQPTDGSRHEVWIDAVSLEPVGLTA